MKEDASRERPAEAWPVIEDDEIGAVADVLRSGRLNYWTGELNRRFEEAFAARTKTTHGVAVANGTLALELAMHAIGLQPEDEVVVPARSFIATASCVVRGGGRPVFADVDPETQNISAETVEPCLTRRTRAVISVHLAGHPCDMEPMVSLCRDHRVLLVEDCAQAHGAAYRGNPVGGIGDLGCFSFCQDKIMTTGGEGGMLVTSSPEVWERAWAFKDHGKSRRDVYRDDHPPGFRWLHDRVGSNFRLTEIQAAIGLRQLVKLDEWVRVRRRNARILHAALADHPLLRFPFEADYARSSFYKVYLFVRPERLASGWTRDRLAQEVRDNGIPCISGHCPEIYREKAFAGGPFGPGRRLPNARKLGETSLMTEVHPTLSEATMHERAQVLRGLCDGALA